MPFVVCALSKFSPKSLRFPLLPIMLTSLLLPTVFNAKAQVVEPSAEQAQQEQPLQLLERRRTLVEPEPTKPARPFHGVRYIPGARTNGGDTVECTSPELSYFGGPVISNVQIVVVYWNTDVNTGIVANIPGFFEGLTNSTWFDMLSEYSTNITPSGGEGGTNQSIGRGKYEGAYMITPSRCPASTDTCKLSDADIQTEIQEQIDSNVLPSQTYDSNGYSNTLYMIYFPPLVTVTGPNGAGTSCTAEGFCAYHNTGGTTAAPLTYGVLMDQFTSACTTLCGSGSTDLENQEMVSSHELADAVTDTEIGLDTGTAFQYPAAWGDNNNSCGENGDICFSGSVYGVTTPNGTEYVQPVWSNALGECVTSGLHPEYALSTPATVTAGAPFSFTLTAQNPSGGLGTDIAYIGTVHFTSSDTAATLPADFTFTSADKGTANFQATLQTGAVQTVTATDTVNSAMTATNTFSIGHSEQVSVLTSPDPGTVFTGPNQTFKWTAVTGAEGYMLWLGTTGVGSKNLYNSGKKTATSVTVTGLPTSGKVIYARLFTTIGSVTKYGDYTYTAAEQAVLTTPKPGTVLPGSNVTFEWSAGTGSTTGYSLWLGSKGVGSKNLYNSGKKTVTSVKVTGLPTNGKKVYARLYTYIEGVMVHSDYTYTAK